MPILTIIKEPKTEKISVEVDINQWEKIADALGFYQASFLETLKQSLKESKNGRVRKIESLKELKHS